ncbi:MAG TPA: hypothetical protein VEC06_08565 [Paucimonas sp.]|nr:hypothetical protein [Paucimonas sp.]
MANPKFCYPNWTLPSSIYTPTLTGSGWTDLAKLQGDVLSEMARYPGVNPANTKVVIDLATTRAIEILALPFHNAKLGDKARIEVATDAGFTSIALDTGFKEFFGEIYPYGTLPWGSENWLDGQMTEEQAAGRRIPWIHVASEPVLGRYLRVSLDFSTNSDGYADLGQVIASPALTPVYNVSYGVSVPFYRDPSVKTRSRGGVQFAEKHEKYRVCSMQLDWLGTDELYGQFFEFVREYGVSKPFFFIYDSDAATAILKKQSFMAVAEMIGDPKNRLHDTNSLPVDISETF